MTIGLLSMYCVATMYVDTSKIKNKTKTYSRHLLRTSFRENGKVKHKTIANLSSCSKDEIKAIKLALKHKNDLTVLSSVKNVKTILGKRMGAVWVMYELAKRLGIVKTLGSGLGGKLALLQIIARICDQGSRLSAVRFAKRHAICEIIGIEKLDEDDLYENLKWLADEQETIEKKMFKLRYSDQIPTLFLYDVTSSYLEGTHNELAAWGYNRDKKRGKMQIVVGLLVGPDGLPVAVRVFKGNTQDTKTVSEQVRILAKSFGAKQVTLVGDRGMIKGPQINDLPKDFRYITAITKPQIRKKLESSVFQYELFTERICEVEEDGVRYVLRRNPVRACQIANTREGKFNSIQNFVQERNRYLSEHPGASVKTALKKINAKIKKLKSEEWIKTSVDQRQISIEKNEFVLEEISLLDGCYAIKSNVSKKDADAKTLHERYCDLEGIERSFRTMKTTHLEIRPVFVRKKKSTESHVFITMLALLLQRKLEEYWVDLDLTVEEGIDELGAIHMEDVFVGKTKIQNIPIPNQIGKKLLEKAKICLPSVLPDRTASVHTKKKLNCDRISK